MKRIMPYFLFFLIFYTGCSMQVPSNEKPMYDSIPRTPAEQKADKRFIEEVIKEAGSKEAAIKNTLALVRYYTDKGDFSTAMKRANQAWLLDPNNAEVFDLFGSILQRQGKSYDAIPLFKRALEIGPARSLTMCNLGRAYYDNAYNLYRQHKKGGMEHYLNDALESYEKASKIATSNGDLSYIYYQWAVSLTLKEDYRSAWQKVRLSRQYGGECIEPGFIRELSRLMPEPKG